MLMIKTAKYLLAEDSAGRYRPHIPALVTALLLSISAAFAPVSAEPTHGLSAFGQLKYRADFKHFDYVNPSAPKGGKLAMIGTAGLATFDSFNGYILRGNAAQGLELMFDSLMTRADDEPDAVYGLVAKSADLAADKMSVTFQLRKEAKFADGTLLRAADVKFSFDILKKSGYPSYKISMRDIIAAQVIDPLTIRYTFKGTQIRDLPLIVAQLPIFSKAYYAKHDFSKTTLKPPLGSGPYKISRFNQGRVVDYERRKDYWAARLPVNIGRFNFDTLRYEYYRSRIAELENLKSGTYDLREEFTSKDWATAYNIPQVKSGRILLLTLPDKRPGGAQGFFLNMRRSKFKDIRVRKALDLAFDFEWTNKNLFYSLYKRTQSIFENSNMKASGLPSKGELKLLQPFAGKLPPSVFKAPYVPPVSNGSGADRKLLRKAVGLLNAAGWKIKSGERIRRNAKGEAFKIEFLISSQGFDRIIQPFVRNLAAIGISATIRLVDSAQYEARRKSFDFDVIIQRFVLALTPGNELKTYLNSDVADIKGSFNLSGIKNPVIDAMIKHASEAKSRAELIDATRALDRVLRAGNYWVPHWYKAAHNIAHWDKFSRPVIKPAFARGVIDTWWYDKSKAARLKTK